MGFLCIERFDGVSVEAFVDYSLGLHVFGRGVGLFSYDLAIGIGWYWVVFGRGIGRYWP